MKGSSAKGSQSFRGGNGPKNKSIKDEEKAVKETKGWAEEALVCIQVAAPNNAIGGASLGLNREESPMEQLGGQCKITFRGQRQG